MTGTTTRTNVYGREMAELGCGMVRHKSRQKQKEFLTSIKEQLMKEREELEKKILLKRAALAAKPVATEAKPQPAEHPIVNKPSGDMNVNSITKSALSIVRRKQERSRDFRLTRLLARCRLRTLPKCRAL